MRRYVLPRKMPALLQMKLREKYLHFALLFTACANDRVINPTLLDNFGPLAMLGSADVGTGHRNNWKVVELTGRLRKDMEGHGRTSWKLVECPVSVTIYHLSRNF